MARRRHPAAGSRALVGTLTGLAFAGMVAGFQAAGSAATAADVPSTPMPRSANAGVEPAVAEPLSPTAPPSAGTAAAAPSAPPSSQAAAPTPAVAPPTTGTSVNTPPAATPAPSPSASPTASPAPSPDPGKAKKPDAVTGGS